MAVCLQAKVGWSFFFFSLFEAKELMSRYFLEQPWTTWGGFFRRGYEVLAYKLCSRFWGGAGGVPFSSFFPPDGMEFRMGFSFLIF